MNPDAHLNQERTTIVHTTETLSDDDDAAQSGEGSDLGK